MRAGAPGWSSRPDRPEEASRERRGQRPSVRGFEARSSGRLDREAERVGVGDGLPDRHPLGESDLEGAGRARDVDLARVHDHLGTGVPDAEIPQDLDDGRFDLARVGLAAVDLVEDRGDERAGVAGHKTSGGWERAAELPPSGQTIAI